MNPTATVLMSSGAQIVIELFPDNAPNACASFISLAKRGLYDMRNIERIVPGFVIQPSYDYFQCDEMNYDIKGEFASAGYKNGLKCEERSVCMAGDGKALSSGSEFFFSLAYTERLDGNFTVIGKVVSGWDEVKRLEKVDTVPIDNDMGVIVNRPIGNEMITKLTIETFGAEYPEPIKYTF